MTLIYMSHCSRSIAELFLNVSVTFQPELSSVTVTSSDLTWQEDTGEAKRSGSCLRPVRVPHRDITIVSATSLSAVEGWRQAGDIRCTLLPCHEHSEHWRPVISVLAYSEYPACYCHLDTQLSKCSPPKRCDNLLTTKWT
jgi:hypothetical protein